MGRPRKSAPSEIPAEEESREVPDEEPARTMEPEPVPAGAFSQSDAAREVLDVRY
jgi:hypothetical protein